MARGERAAEGQLGGKHSCSDDARQLAGVVTGRSHVGAADAEDVEKGRLRLEDGAATDGTDFDGGHGDRDVQVAVDAGERLVFGVRESEISMRLTFS